MCREQEHVSADACFGSASINGSYLELLNPIMETVARERCGNGGVGTFWR